MRVGVVVIEIVVHRLDHLPRHLCSAGTVEVGDGKLIVNAFERRKTGANIGSRS